MKERYNGMNAYVEMTQGVDSSMLASLGARRRRRLLIVIALLLAVVVIAPYILVTPELYGWLSEVAPPIAHLISPRHSSDEENGVRMKVVSATLDGNVMEVEVTFEDFEYERFNEHTIPYGWNIAELTSYSRELTACSYDEETRMLTCLFRFTYSRDQELLEQLRSPTFYVERLERDDDSEIAELPVDITLTDSSRLDIKFHEYRGASLQEPIGLSLVQLQEGREITGMTIIDGDLHVQIRHNEDIASGSCTLKLTGPDGKLIRILRQYSFSENSVTYGHQVFALDGLDIDACTLTVCLDPAQRITGPWNVVLTPKTVK